MLPTPLPGAVPLSTPGLLQAYEGQTSRGSEKGWDMLEQGVWPANVGATRRVYNHPSASPYNPSASGGHVRLLVLQRPSGWSLSLSCRPLSELKPKPQRPLLDEMAILRII